MKQKVAYDFSDEQKKAALNEALKHVPSNVADGLYMLEQAAIRKRFVKSISYEQKAEMFHIASAAWNEAIKLMTDLPDQLKLILIVGKMISLCTESAHYSYKAIVDDNGKKYEEFLMRELIALSFCCMVGKYSRLESVKDALLMVAIIIIYNIGETETGLLFLKVATEAKESGYNNVSTKLFYEFAVYNLKVAYNADKFEPKISEAYHQALAGFMDGLLATQQVAFEVDDKEEHDKCNQQIEEISKELQNFVKRAAISDADISDGSSVTMNTSDISDDSHVMCEISGTEDEHVDAHTTESIEPVAPSRSTLRYRKRF